MSHLYVIISVLLLLCLFPMPYGYYTFVRFISMSTFIYLGIKHFKNKQESIGFIFISLALLFQPFFKLALGRILWNLVDMIVAGILILLFIKEGTNADSQK